MLHHLGWDGALDRALSGLTDASDLEPARVMAVHRGRCAVTGDGLDGLLPVAGALTAAAREPSDLPTVGDWVAVAGGAVIRHVLPRRTLLARTGEGPGREALAANVDLCCVLTSLDQDLNVRRAERFLALARSGGIAPLVVCTKGDRSADPIGEAARFGEALGAETLVISTLDGWGVQALRSRFVARTTVALVGMSGVGKSTLVNTLLGEERQRILSVRTGDDRGRHATTHREAFVLPEGAMIIDLPGVRLPRLTDETGLDETFADVEVLAAGCRFADCRHEHEPGCSVRAAIADGRLSPDRLASLRRLEREGRTAAQRRQIARDAHVRYRREVRERKRAR